MNTVNMLRNERPQGPGTVPTADMLLARARALEPLLDAKAEQGEAGGALTAEVVAALREGGFLGLWTPKSAGGSDLAPLEVLAVLEALTYADPSVGWVMSTSTLGAGGAGVFLGDDAVETMFRAEGLPFVAGQGVPNGKAVAAPGGYRVSGSWNYGSGLKHADFVCIGTMVQADGAPRLREGVPEMRFMFLPKSSVQLDDNWDVMGLRATGSVDHAVSDVFVPEEYSFPAVSPVPSREGRARLGFAVLAPVGHSAFAIGIGRRMLSELTLFAQSRRGRPGALGDSDAFHERYAQAQAQFHAARAFVREAWQDAEESHLKGEALSPRQATLLRLSMINVTTVVADICVFSYRAAGGVALRRGIIQRLFRDIHAGTQHIVCGAAALRGCGADLLGPAAARA